MPQLNLYQAQGPSIEELLARPKTLLVCSHSGGKDSQAMTLQIRDMVPPERFLLIHARLPGMDWDGIPEHIEATAGQPAVLVQAGKTFFEMSTRRGMWPSPNFRQCTSDLKMQPIRKEVIRVCTTGGFDLVVNATGIRAQESSNRSKLAQLEHSPSKSVGKRAWWEWRPIFHLSEKEVFRRIAEAGQSPHPAYGMGMTRLSCVFCIMSSQKDIETAGRLRPDLLAQMSAMERQMGHTFIMPTKKGKKFLDELANPTPNKTNGTL